MIREHPVPDVVVRAEATVGEGPVWDRRTGQLCWVDIVEGRLVETDLTTGTSRTTDVGTMLGAAVPRADEPGFAVAVADGFGFVTDGVLTLADPVLPEPLRRMNDAKCDAAGRLWAGSTHLDFAPGGGALHRWDGHGPSTAAAAGLTLPNGLGWDADETVMYLADSTDHVVLSAPFFPDEGAIGELRPVCRVDAGLPDGLAVDLDGCLWVAVWGAWAVHRYSPTGELLERVPMPVAQPSSCAFDDDGTLYITSARSGLTPDDLTRQPLAGSVFALGTTTRGVPVHAFAG